MNIFILFLIGIVEMSIVAIWTKFVSKSMVIASGVTTFINIFIWYYVLRIIIDNIDNFSFVLFYALGCSIGTIIGTYILKK